MPIGDRQASCASWQQALDLSIWCHVFRMLNLFSFHLISSHRSFSWKLLTAPRCHRSPCHPISSQFISCLLNFAHLISALRSSCHLIKSYLSLFDVVSFSSKSTCSLVVFHGCSSHVKTSDLSSVFHFFYFFNFIRIFSYF